MGAVSVCAGDGADEMAHMIEHERDENESALQNAEDMSSARNSGSYQDLLRAVGALLDADNAGRITIIETSNGFVVRRQRFRHTIVDQAVTHLTRETLSRQALELREGKPAGQVSRR